MKNEELIKAVSDIEDEYIEEAAQVQKKQSGKGSSFVRGRKWVKWAGAVAALLVLVLVGNMLADSGLFTNYKKAASDEGYYYAGDDLYDSESVSYAGLSYSSDSRKNAGSSVQSASIAPEEAESPSGSYGGSDDGHSATGIYDASKVKLIYTGYVKAQTTDFAEADAAIREMVAKAGGYFEGQSISNGNYYNGDYLKKASYTIRIPAERFEEFLSGVKEGVTVKSLEQYTQDIGLSYSETEQRLETLRIKLARLQELLRQATNMSDIITIENEISNTEAQIESYTNTINRYDSLIGFSTVNLELTEVAKPGTGIDEKEGFFKKLGRTFVEGLSNAGEGFANFFYWISYNFVGILIFAAIVFCLIKFRPFTKLFKKIFKKD